MKKVSKTTMSERISIAKGLAKTLGISLTVALMIAFVACSSPTEPKPENGNNKEIDVDDDEDDKDPQAPVVMAPWEPIVHPKVMRIGTFQDPDDLSDFHFSLVDKTRLGEYVDENGKDANGQLVKSLVTQDILKNFEQMIPLQEDVLMGNIFMIRDFRSVMVRGLRVIIENTEEVYETKTNFNTLYFHIDFLNSITSAAQLRQIFSSRIRNEVLHHSPPEVSKASPTIADRLDALNNSRVKFAGAFGRGRNAKVWGA